MNQDPSEHGTSHKQCCDSEGLTWLTKSQPGKIYVTDFTRFSLPQHSLSTTTLNFNINSNTISRSNSLPHESCILVPFATLVWTSIAQSGRDHRPWLNEVLCDDSAQQQYCLALHQQCVSLSDSWRSALLRSYS